MEAEPEKKGLSAEWAVAEVDHLFHALGRYTRFVVLSKWFLAALAVGLITILVMLPLLSKDRSGIRVSFVDSAANATKDAEHPVMRSPEFRGVDEKGEQYKINGIRATQTTTNLVTIDQVEAQLLTQNGGWRSLTSKQAVYDQLSKIIELEGEVTMIDDQGYSFVTEHATIDSRTSKVSGNQRVTGVGPLGNLLASGFEIRDSGSHIIFTGGAEQVHLHLDRARKRP